MNKKQLLQIKDGHYLNMSQTTANLLYELIEVKQEMKNSIERKGSIVEGGLVVYPEAIDNISQGITEEEKQ